VTEALDAVGYRGLLSFECSHPCLHYPEALIWKTSDSLDRILGRKA
jgi:hexulose-6-phosphate isomerase